MNPWACFLCAHPYHYSTCPTTSAELPCWCGCTEYRPRFAFTNAPTPIYDALHAEMSAA